MDEHIQDWEELDRKWREMWPKRTCPDCGHEEHEGYDLICTTPNCPTCVNGQCLRYTNTLDSTPKP